MKKFIAISLLSVLAYAPVAQSISVPTTATDFKKQFGEIKEASSESVQAAGKYLNGKKEALATKASEAYNTYAPAVKEATKKYANGTREFFTRSAKRLGQETTAAAKWVGVKTQENAQKLYQLAKENPRHTVVIAAATALAAMIVWDLYNANQEEAEEATC